MGLRSTVFSPLFTGEVHNNFISLSEPNSNDMRGIVETAPGNNNLNIYFNSINLSGNVTGFKNSDCYHRTNASNTNFKNNILVNSRTGGTGKHYAIRTDLPMTGVASDYNDIFTTGGTGNVFGKIEAIERIDLTDWKTASGKDSNSISADPEFVSSTDLHIDSTASSPVNAAGTTIVGITTDFDNNSRSVTPDIGADEFRSTLNLNLTLFIEGFYHTGTDSQITDTISVYLRNSSSPFAAVDSAKAVVGTNGVAALNFVNAENGSYYIQLKHRNTIETWSASPVSVTSASGYNFTTSASQAYGSNMKQVDTSPVRFGIYSGDVNQDGVIDAPDLSLIDNDASNFAAGYLRTDLDGSNFIDAIDAAIADNNASNFISKISP